MEKVLIAHSEPKTTAEYKAAIEALVGRFQQLNAQMDRNWQEIERIKAETAEINADNERIKARLQSRLDDLIAHRDMD